MTMGIEGVDPAGHAMSVLDMIRGGRYAEAEARFGAKLRAQVSAQNLQVAWEGAILQRGAITGLGDPIVEPCQTGLTQVSIPVVCENGGLTVVQTLDGAGTVEGLRLAPPILATWEPPAYARPGRFTEQEVVLTARQGAVSGTLTTPRGARKRPAVVLLSGGGPFDRDQTHGPNKPLKDLAWGLASKGVTVLRFDKVTCAEPGLTAQPHFTVTDEYVPHALAAIRLLQARPEVDASRVYVLGHSMGGKVTPRVAAAEPSLAGLVIMAADTRPMQWSAVRVARYLADLSPGPEADSMVDVVAAQAARVDSPDLSAHAPAAELLFGFSGSYWLDMRGYDPVSVAADVGKPMLILQGGRDYQVTVEDDLAGWRAGLGHRRDVSIRVFERDDHMFFAGDGPSSPAGYEAPQHVDSEVVAEIARWIQAGGTLTHKPRRTLIRWTRAHATPS
jgi:uncharacterized protein